jgi:hypothetical protein
MFQIIRINGQQGYLIRGSMKRIQGGQQAGQEQQVEQLTSWLIVKVVTKFQLENQVPL